MMNVLILGSVNIGSLTATLLQNSGDYAVTQAFRNKEQLHTASKNASLIRSHLNIHSDEFLSLFQKYHILFLQLFLPAQAAHVIKTSTLPNQ